jgi:flagellar biosynthesis protein FliR
MMISFPIKMLLALTLLAWLVSIFPRVFEQSTAGFLQVVGMVLPH